MKLEESICATATLRLNWYQFSVNTVAGITKVSRELTLEDENKEKNHWLIFKFYDCVPAFAKSMWSQIEPRYLKSLEQQRWRLLLNEEQFMQRQWLYLLQSEKFSFSK